MVPVSCVITSNNSSWANDCDDVICREMLPLATDWMQMAAFVVRNVIGWWSASSDSILQLFTRSIGSPSLFYTILSLGNPIQGAEVVSWDSGGDLLILEELILDTCTEMLQCVEKTTTDSHPDSHTRSHSQF